MFTHLSQQGKADYILQGYFNLGCLIMEVKITTFNMKTWEVTRIKVKEVERRAREEL